VAVEPPLESAAPHGARNRRCRHSRSTSKDESQLHDRHAHLHRRSDAPSKAATRLRRLSLLPLRAAIDVTPRLSPSRRRESGHTRSGEHVGALLGHDEDVLQPASSEALAVNARLDGDHFADDELVGPGPQNRGLADFQAESVAEDMVEAVVQRLGADGRVAGRLDDAGGGTVAVRVSAPGRAVDIGAVSGIEDRTCYLRRSLPGRRCTSDGRGRPPRHTAASRSHSEGYLATGEVYERRALPLTRRLRRGEPPILGCRQSIDVRLACVEGVPARADQWVRPLWFFWTRA
jgi:hypothetical protein